MLVFLHIEDVEVEELVLARLVQTTQGVQDGQVVVAHRGGRVVLQETREGNKAKSQ